jgi:hypothetical protein
LHTIRAIFAGGERRTEEKESSSLHHTEESDSEGELHIDMDSGSFPPTLFFLYLHTKESYKKCNLLPVCTGNVIRLMSND